MEHYTIRYADIRDYTEVEKIMMQVHDLHVGLRPDIYRQSSIVLPYDVFADAVSHGQFIVAETEDRIVGILFYMIRHVGSATQVTRDTLFIDSMAVDEAYRGRGIGHLLFDQAKTIQKEKGLDAIELQVNARNLAAKEMYEKYGFTEKSINMELTDCQPQKIVVR